MSHSTNDWGYAFDRSHLYIFIYTYMYIHICISTHIWMTEDMRLTVATCVTWLVHMCDVTRSHVWRDSFTYVTWLIHMCDVTHSHVWHGSFTCATWLILKGDVTHSYMGHALLMRHDSFTCVAWLIHECDRTQSYGQHDRTHSYRVAKFCRMSYLYRSFPAKEPYN